MIFLGNIGLKAAGAGLGYLHRRVLLRVLVLCVNRPAEEGLFFFTTT